MNRWRWILLFCMFGNAYPLLQWANGREATGLSITLWIGALAAQIVMFLFMKSPLRKDGQGGNLQLPIRTRRHPQR